MSRTATDLNPSSRYSLATDKFAYRNLVEPQTVRKQYCRTGSYFGVVPLRLPNGRLLWPDDSIERLIEAEMKLQDSNTADELATTDSSARHPSCDSRPSQLGRSARARPRPRVVKPHPVDCSVTGGLDALPIGAGANVAAVEQSTLRSAPSLAAGATETVEPHSGEERLVAARRRQAEAEATAIRGMMGEPRRSPPPMKFPLFAEPIRQLESKPGAGAKSGENESPLGG